MNLASCFRHRRKIGRSYRSCKYIKCVAEKKKTPKAITIRLYHVRDVKVSSNMMILFSGS